MGINGLRSAVGDALYQRSRQAVLRLFFSHPDESFLQSDAIRRIGKGSGTVQRELKRLSDAEILLRRVEGRQTYFEVNRKCPVFDELRGLVRKTFGVSEAIHDALSNLLSGIDLAFIFGSIASGKENVVSGFDLMVVSDRLSLSDLVTALRQTQRMLGREINPTLFGRDEFSRKLLVLVEESFSRYGILTMHQSNARHPRDFPR
jgi:predicted nucleotidyltransferase